MRVMDLQQEQLARSLGEGHRVIHGVAGSGKTLILGYRAEHLARVCVKPILVLCYNKALAGGWNTGCDVKGVADKVHVAQLPQPGATPVDRLHVGLAPQAMPTRSWHAMVQAVIEGVERGI
jgi:hypothetical protein